MSRKINMAAIAAFNNGSKLSRQNRTVTHDGQTSKLYLFGNLIAKRVDGQLSITNAGWFSSTTKGLLNCLDGVHIHQSKFEWYLNGQPWDGAWVDIK